MEVLEKCFNPKCRNKCRYGFPGSNLVDSCGIHAKGTSRIVLLNKNFKPIILSDNNEDIIVIDIENVDTVDTVDLNDNNVSSLGATNQVNRKKTGCQEEGCLVTRPTYGYPGTKGLYCSKHGKPKGMVDVKHKKCSCGKARPSFGSEKGKPTHCKGCSKPGMKDVTHKMCKVCDEVRPSYGFEKGKATHCERCSKPGMKDVISKMCEVCDVVRPSYGFEKGQATHCERCSKPGMKDVISKMCETCDVVRPTYGFEKGESTHCRGCSKPGMKNVKDKMCKTCDIVHPSYGFEKGKPTHCRECSKPGMKDVKHKMCEVCGTVRPNYGFEKGKATHCERCSKPGMKNVKDKMCEVCDIVQPSYGFEKGKATHCRGCSKPGMRNVISKMCEESNCNERAYHGLPGNLGTLCTQHKKIGMIRNPRRKCFQTNCKEIALFGESTHQYCGSHSNPDMHNFIERECISCHLPEILNSEMKCKNCDEVHFMKRRLMKQNKIRDLLLARDYKFDTCDKIIEGSCDRERPDFVYYSKYQKHVVIIEVDENQHASYHNNVTFRGVPTNCETVRMINIVHSFAGLKVIFIRYNPDQFKVNGKKQEVRDLKRHETLISYLKYYIEMDISDEEDNWLQVKYLFYDDYDPTNSELIKIPIEYNNLSDQDFNEYNELLGYEQDIDLEYGDEDDFEDEYDFEEKNPEENSTLLKNNDDCADGYFIEI